MGLLVNPELCFGEAYTARRLEIRGGSRQSSKPSIVHRRPWIEWMRAALELPNTLAVARRHVHHHYDLGNAFHQRWLDRDLVYTCAYFANPQMSLRAAQRAKLDLVCRKLCLRPGDTVVEAGCGWGALALYMARHYGVHVRAFNISSEQLAYARARARRERLTDRVEFIDDDYRNVTGECDAFVSIGMLDMSAFRSFARWGTSFGAACIAGDADCCTSSDAMHRAR